MANNTSFIIGVDVGGTHTDCAIVSLSGAILGKHKSLTTADITSGIVDAVQSALGTCHVDVTETAYLSIGTTHFINAVVQRASSLARVVCIRACGVSSVGIPPCADMPEDLRALVCESVAFVRGGFEFDGQPLSDFDEEVVKEQLRDALEKPVQDGVTQVVVSGVFSVLDTAQERRLAELVEQTVEELGGEVSVTLSCELAGIGLLERENAGVLNASLKPLAEETVAAFEKSVQAMGLSCPLYLTQNDGTLLTAERARQVPVLTFASGMTNSMRGAAFLTGHKDAIVVDIGGTTTDVGVLSDGFPRPSAVEALVGGVRTSFRMPDTLSIGLGGGSRVHVDGDQVTVGPDSVGFDLLTQARTFGGDEFTATDVAVALRGVDILAAGKAEPKAVSADDLGGEATVAKAMDAIVAAVSDAVDRVKTTATALPLICVGGGSALVSHLEKLPPAPGQQTDSAGPLVVPEHFEVANAIGAAIAQVSGNVDKVIALAGQDRDKIVEELKAEAIEAAVAGGAERSTTHVTSVAETPVPYVPGENVRFQVRAVGSLSGLASAAGGDSDGDGDAAGAQPEEAREPDKVPSATVHGLPGGGRLKSTPNANEEGVWELNEQDVDYIATGAGILGTGGGGDPHYATIRAKAGLREGKPIRVISPDAVAADDLVFPAAFMGAPTMLVEKLVTGTETAGAVEAMSATSQGKAAAVLSCEIGGLNGVEPLITAQSSGLPVCDADLMGRAFPKLDMALTVINGVPPVPAGLADDKGNALLLFKCASGAWLEKLMRTATVAMGCVAALSLPPLRGDQLAANTVPYSVSYAWTIGKAVHEARAAKADPVAAAVEVTGGRLLFAGKVVDVHRFTEGGFSKGVVTITGLPPASDRDGEDFSNQTLKLDVQNEYLMARTPQGEVLACVPDLISVLNTDTGKNVFTESIMFGLRVSVIAMPSHPMMVSEKALKAVGPHAFGYDQVEFVPAE